MAETHINAFFGAVDEALAKVQAAQGELRMAQERLETKKKEVGYVAPETPKVETPKPEEKPVTDTRNRK